MKMKLSIEKMQFILIATAFSLTTTMEVNEKWCLLQFPCNKGIPHNSVYMGTFLYTKKAAVIKSSTAFLVQRKILENETNSCEKNSFLYPSRIFFSEVSVQVGWKCFECHKEKECMGP